MKVMIDEKKIEEAAGNFIEYLPYYEKDGKNLYDENSVITAFKEGINWFLENLLHKGEVCPTEKNKDIFVIEREGEQYFHFNSGEYCKPPYSLNWKEYMEISKPTRWLYIEDLMKGGK